MWRTCSWCGSFWPEPVSMRTPSRGGCWETWPTAKADRRLPLRQQVEVCFAHLKRVFGMERTLAKTLTGLATRIAAKVAAYTYGCYVNRMLSRPQGRIKELWA